MLIFVLGVTCVIVIIAIVKYRHAGSKNRSTIPGLDPSDKKYGNLSDIAKAGSIHEFLEQLHRQFGEIASFWYGESYFVSIASPSLFKEHSRVFDRPHELFKEFEQLLTLECIQFANGADGKARRKLYDPCFSHHAVELFHDTFKTVTQVFVDKLLTVSPQEHIPLEESMFALAIKNAMAINLGSFSEDDAQISEFMQSYNVAMEEIGRWIYGAEPEPESTKKIEQAKIDMFGTIKKAMDYRRKNRHAGHEKIFIDIIMASGRPESEILCDIMEYIIASFHTTGLLPSGQCARYVCSKCDVIWLPVMAWGLYFLACHQEIQAKVYKELKQVLGDEEMPVTAILELRYMHQVLDETLRCAVVGPYAARVQYVDSELGGHTVPAGTPVMHALGVVMQDEKLWPHPRTFDPNRFIPEKCKERPNYAFEPFGFAGKRKCPGYRMAYAEAIVVFAMLLTRFKFKMVPGQNVTPAYGFVTRPKEEIWVTVEKR